MNRTEIERELAGKGDYVLIDNITRFLKENVPQDIKRFCYLKLVEIYERRNMFSEEANIYGRLTEIAINSSDRKNYIIQEIGCFVKAGLFDRADATIRELGEEVKETERRKILTEVIDVYKRQAGIYEKERRRSHAAKTYEKILSMNIPEAEKNEINKKLLVLYKELGMVGEYMKMKSKLGI